VVERESHSDWRDRSFVSSDSKWDGAGSGRKDCTGVIPSIPPPTITTLGFGPTCTCDADVTPCTVLDPFAGAGTTLLAARELGRDSIGIEVNPEYADMARKRIEDDAIPGKQPEDVPGQRMLFEATP